MSAIGPGDLVECLVDGEPYGFPLRLGAIYTVTDVRHHPKSICGCHDQNAGGLRFAEVRNMPDGNWDGWCALCFRPAGRRDESLIKDLLRPVDQPAEPVPA